MKQQEHVSERVLGRDAGPLTLHDMAGNRLACTHMAQQARHDLCLLTRDLDKNLYDQAPFLLALRELALRNHFKPIRILLQDPEQVVRQGHRVIELARRLTSRIEIRIPGEDWRDLAESFLLADRFGYIHRELGTRYEAVADFHAPLMVRRLQARFDDIWSSAQAASELRRLHI